MIRLRSSTAGVAAAAILLVALLLAMGGCTEDRSAGRDAADHEERLVVATTVAPHAWLARQIAGDRATVLVALSGIASCHDHAPPEAAVVSLAGADLYLRAGIGAEDGAWLETVIRHGGMPVVDLLAAARTGLPEDLATAIGADPHAWTSPGSLRRQAAAIADALAALRPGGEADFRAAAARLDARLADLQAAVDTRLASARGTTIVVDHAAWTWLAAEHGIRQVAVVPEPGSTSDHSLEDIRRMMVDEGLRTIIIQPQHDSRSSRALAESVNAELVSLDPMAPDAVASIGSAAEVIQRISGASGAGTDGRGADRAAAPASGPGASPVPTFPAAAIARGPDRP